MIGGIALPSSPPLLEQALVVIADLAAVTGTAVRVGVLDGSAGGRGRHRTRAGPRPTASPTTRRPRTPAPWAGCSWRSAPPRSSTRSIAAARATAGGTPFSPERLRRLLATTRLTRVAVHRDAEGGRCEVAVPVFGTGGLLLAGLEATVPDLTTGFEQARGALLVAAGSLSRQLATTHAPEEPEFDSADGPEDAAG